MLDYKDNMKYSIKITLYVFLVLLAFFVLIGLISSREIGSLFIIGSFIISSLISIVVFICAMIYTYLFPKNVETPQIAVSGQNFSTVTSPEIKYSNKKLIIGVGVGVGVVVLLLLLLAFILNGGSSQSTGQIKKESLPEFNIHTESPRKVAGMIGQPTNSKIEFSGSVFVVTTDNTKKYLYKLSDATATQITGLPESFFASGFIPTLKGLVVIVWPTEDKKVDYYLIKNMSATKITKDYPGELLADKVFGSGKVKVSLKDNNSEKKIYFFNSNELFNTIDINQIKHPKIVIADDDLVMNSLIPQTYIFSYGEFSSKDGECNSKVFYIDDKNTALQEIRSSDQKSKIENVCGYVVLNKILWFVTRGDTNATVWKAQNNYATKIAEVKLDDANFYDNEGNKFIAKIRPELETIDTLLMVNTGRNRYLLDQNSLKHIQNISFASVSDSGQIIAYIEPYFFAGCSDASFSNFRLCQYNLSDDVIQEKYLGSIDRLDIRTYKSLYNNEYYLVGIMDLSKTKFYHLSIDNLTQVDDKVDTILYRYKYSKNNYIDVIKQGVVIRYQIPGQYLFSEDKIGSDVGGTYYQSYVKGQSVFDAVYYIPKN